MKRFALAPMSGFLMGLTVFCWFLPAMFVGLAFMGPTQTPMLGVAVFLLLIYLSVWLWWRPGHFSLGDKELKLHFPLRVLSIPFDQMTGCDRWQAKDLKSRYGRTYRVGAGGLWGGFGWLRSSTNEWIEFYISRQSDYIFIERKNACPLLITPERPEEFFSALQALR